MLGSVGPNPPPLHSDWHDCQPIADDLRFLEGLNLEQEVLGSSSFTICISSLLYVLRTSRIKIP
jgi:hypothetical protein